MTRALLPMVWLGAAGARQQALALALERWGQPIRWLRPGDAGAAVDAALADAPLVHLWADDGVDAQALQQVAGAGRPWVLSSLDPAVFSRVRALPAGPSAACWIASSERARAALSSSPVDGVRQVHVEAGFDSLPLLATRAHRRLAAPMADAVRVPKLGIAGGSEAAAVARAVAACHPQATLLAIRDGLDGAALGDALVSCDAVALTARRPSVVQRLRAAAVTTLTPLLDEPADARDTAPPGPQDAAADEAALAMRVSAAFGRWLRAPQPVPQALPPRIEEEAFLLRQVYRLVQAGAAASAR